ncbi:MAG: hypothetical protein JRJ65_20115, partial [Deltaproteobacteria bacterium]|nr:hypothetical protein [Deltaproteobacteria bacterium]
MQEICFYGERGIVNGLVLDIWKDLDLIRVVLRSIDWCKPSKHGWIDNLTRVTFLVEPGFGKFGQPDLLMICDIEDGSKRWLFIEAKSTPYHASSMSNQKGMTVKGYNSSINGQLSLDYRLALALERYEIGPILEESRTVFEQYNERLLDYNNGPRKAAKPELLEGIVNPYLQDLQLEKTFFVAMTRDEGFNPIKNAAEDELPLVIDGKGNNRWHELGTHFGFLSLKELDLKVLKLNGYYRRGCQLHIGPWI